MAINTEAVETTRTCPMCQADTTMSVPAQALTARQNGIPIQDAWPEGTPAQREFVKTGSCTACQDMVFDPFAM